MAGTSEQCIANVPDDLLMHMFKYLSVKDLCQCERFEFVYSVKINEVLVIVYEVVARYITANDLINRRTAI